MQKIKRLLIIVLLICMLFPIIVPTISNAAYNQEQVGTDIANFAEKLVTEGNQRGILRYSQAAQHRTDGYNFKLSTGGKAESPTGTEVGEEVMNGKLTYDCSSFVSYVYSHVTNNTAKFLWSTDEFDKEDAKYSADKYFDRITDLSKIKTGDILWKDGHVAIFLRGKKVAQASTWKNSKTEQLNVKEVDISNFTCAYRLKEDIVKQIEQLNTNLDWTDLGLESIYGAFYYNGLAKRSEAVKAKPFIAYDFFTELSDYIIGTALLFLKIQAIGWTAIFEDIISSMVYSASGDDSIDNQRITVEKIIYNKVPSLNINFFDLSTSSGTAQEAEASGEEQTIGKSSSGQATDAVDVIYIIRDNIARVYYTFRNIAIIGLLIVLIYIGIRIAVATIASEKAKYTQMFINWLVSFIIVFFIHFFMLGTILLNQVLVERLSREAIGEQETIIELRLVDSVDEKGNKIMDPRTGQPAKILKEIPVTITRESSIYDTILTKAYDLKASQGITGTIMYMFLVYYLVKFLLIYFKRLLSINILAIISPLIAISYAIDKIKDNKSQSLGRWMGDFSINVFIQSIHGLLYIIFVKTAYDLAFDYSLVGVIIAFVFLNFMLKAEELLLKMFNFGGKSSSFKPAVNATTGAYVAAMGAWKVTKTLTSAGVGTAGLVKTGAVWTKDKFADTSLGSKIAGSKWYSNSIGKVSNTLYVHDKDKAQIRKMVKARKELRAARKAEIAGTWGAISGTASSGAKLLSSFAKMVANPGQGITGLMSSRQALASKLGKPGNLKYSEEKGLAYKGMNAILWATTTGIITADGLENMKNSEVKAREKVEKAEKKVDTLAKVKTEEVKKKMKEKLAKDMKRDAKKGKPPRISHSQVVEAKQAVLRELGMSELQLGELDSLSAELNKGLEPTGEVINNEELNKEVNRMLESTLSQIVSEVNEDAGKMFRGTQTSEEPTKEPTEEQINKTLEKSPERDVLNIISNSLQKLCKDMNDKRALKKVEEYKNRNGIRDELKASDIERVVREISSKEKPKDTHVQVTHTVEDEKKSKYVEIQDRIATRNAAREVKLSQETHNKVKAEIEPIVTNRVNLMEQAKARIASTGGTPKPSTPRFTRIEKDQMQEILGKNMSGEEVANLITTALAQRKVIVKKEETT